MNFRFYDFTHRSFLFADHADNITFVTFEKFKKSDDGQQMLYLNWPEPNDPNGLILSYTIVYKRVDLTNVRPVEQCITQENYRSGEKPLIQMSNGNYSISVKATSLAGDGYLSVPTYVLIGVSDEH